ncbi:MAG TPA: DUF1003 domain-containing protein [Roseiflexaceae bacterium]|nr:DUF1003 domain-containing protein [Roseiflexaceae bacterium]
MEDIGALKYVPLFSFMDDQEIGDIRSMMVMNTYAPGQVIMREGERGTHFYVVARGRVQFAVHDASSHELVVDEVGQGGFFGELSMLTGEPRSVRVKALEQVTTLALEHADFFRFLEQHPQAAIDVLRTLGHRLHRTDSLLRQSVSRNVNQIVDEKLTLGQRIADVIAEFSGSITFLLLNAIFFAAWLGGNELPGFSFDPFPFGLLTMIVSLEAIFLSIFVLVSQNRQAAKDRVAAEIDHQVNTKAEIEIGLLLRRVDDLERSIQHNHQEQCALIAGAAAQRRMVAGDGGQA